MGYPSDSKQNPQAQAHGHHVLAAEDAVIHAPLERALTCAEADANYYAAKSTTLEKELARVRAKSRTRNPRLKTLIGRVERATGRRAAGVTFAPDGCRTIKMGGNAEHEQANGAEINPWDKVL